MRPAVVCDGVALGSNSANELWRLRGGLADQKERGPYAFLGERRQYLCVLGGRGPSSKVRTTSWSAKGSVSRKLFNPTRAWAFASTSRTREVPSTSCRGQSAASVTTIPASSRVTAPASGVVNLSRRVFECATPPPLPEPAALPKHHNLMRFRWLLGKGSLAAGELIYCAIVRTPGPIQRHFARIEGRPSLQRLSAPGGQSSGTLHIT